MVSITSTWELPGTSKIEFVIAMLKEKHPGLKVQAMKNMDFDGVLFRFEGISTVRLDGTFLASASPNEIYDVLAKSIQYKPVGESKVKVSEEDWADRWIRKNVI